MAKFTPIVTEESGYGYRQKPAPTPRRNAAEMEVGRLRNELAAKNAEITELEWKYNTSERANRGLHDQIRNLSYELRSARNSQSSGTTLDLGLWRRILKLIHPDIHHDSSESVEVTRLVIMMKPNR